ncbi:MAG: hypothetical protein AB1665_02605 [Candidatus Thermoplasmatota archaeon]
MERLGERASAADHYQQSLAIFGGMGMKAWAGNAQEGLSRLCG